MKKDRFKRYTVALFAFSAVAVGAKLLLFFAISGIHTNDSFGKCGLVDRKREIANGIASPKFVVIAGSSAIRGINAEKIAQGIGLSAVNFGLHAGLGPDVILHEAKKVLRPGDTAVLALEYNAYRGDTPSDVAISYILGCGMEYFWHASLQSKIKYVFGLGTWRIYESVAHDPETFWQGRGGARTRFTAYGDLPLSPKHFPELTGDDRERVGLYQPIPITFDPSGVGAASIRDFVAWSRDQDVGVIATWANTMYFPEYERNQGLAEIRKFYESLGVPVVGQPTDAMVPISLIYNTNYHLNIEGIAQRTDLLIEKLSEYIEKNRT